MMNDRDELFMKLIEGLQKGQDSLTTKFDDYRENTEKKFEEILSTLKNIELSNKDTNNLVSLHDRLICDTKIELSLAQKEIDELKKKSLLAEQQAKTISDAWKTFWSSSWLWKIIVLIILLFAGFGAKDIIAWLF